MNPVVAALGFTSLDSHVGMGNIVNKKRLAEIHAEFVDFFDRAEDERAACAAGAAPPSSQPSSTRAAPDPLLSPVLPRAPANSPFTPCMPSQRGQNP